MSYWIKLATRSEADLNKNRAHRMRVGGVWMTVSRDVWLEDASWVVSVPYVRVKLQPFLDEGCEVEEEVEIGG